MNANDFGEGVGGEKFRGEAKNVGWGGNNACREGRKRYNRGRSDENYYELTPMRTNLDEGLKRM